MRSILGMMLLSLPMICSAQAEPGTTTSELYIFVDPQPKFPCGVEKMYEFIAKNLTYPQGHFEGTIFVQFVVEIDGSISGAKTMRGVHASIDAEAERVVKQFPKWTPGAQSEKFVQVTMTIPIKVNSE